MKRKMVAAAMVTAAFASFVAAADAEGNWQQLPSNASCMAFLAAASNPNASGHISALAQSGNASTVAQDSATGTGFPGLISCVTQIP
jgi:hypothetical protein